MFFSYRDQFGDFFLLLLMCHTVGEPLRLQFLLNFLHCFPVPSSKFKWIQIKPNPNELWLVEWYQLCHSIWEIWGNMKVPFSNIGGVILTFCYFFQIVLISFKDFQCFPVSYSTFWLLDCWSCVLSGEKIWNLGIIVEWISRFLILWQLL